MPTELSNNPQVKVVVNAVKRKQSRLIAMAVGLAVGATWVCGVGATAAQPAPANIAVLTPGLNYDSVLVGLREGLAKVGYLEGRNLTLTIEDTKGETVNLDGRVAKLLDTKPDVFFAVATANSIAAKQATSTVPIVFTVVGDPVHAQLAASFASSRNNVTGVSSHSTLLTAKRLELLKDLAPKVKSVLVIVSINEASAKMGLPYLDEPAKKMAFRLVRRDIGSTDEFEKLLAEKWTGIDGVFPMPSVFVGKSMQALVAKAHKERLPMVVSEESWVKAGALASYGTDFRLIGAQSARLVVKVLKGSKPAEIPIATPDQLVLTLNQSSAKAIGLKLPEKILERADRFFD